MADAKVPLTDFYVYVLFRHGTGEPFYVGMGRGRRLSTTMRLDIPNFAKKQAIKQARVDGTEIPRVKIASGLTQDAAVQIEIAFIAAIGRGKDGPLVNLTVGGEGTSGYSPTKANRDAVGDAARNRVWTAEMRAAHSVALTGKNIGKKRSPEVIAAMSERSIGNQNGKGNRFKHTLEARAAISSALKGKPKPPMTAEHKAAISAALRSPEVRQKMSNSQKGKKQTSEQIAKTRARMIGNQFVKGKRWTWRQKKEDADPLI